MARSKKDDEAIKTLIILVGVVLFLPFLIISYISYRRLRQQYLMDSNVQRVVDTPRATALFVAVSGGIVGLIYISFIFIDIKIAQFSVVTIFIWAFTLALCFIMAKHLAVVYLSIVADPDHDRLIFPHDMQSYTIHDYLTLRFIHDYCNVDTIQLSSISKMTRGYGKELYLHGDFGSRKIALSSKQKRDECLAMIQSHTGRSGLLAGEIESY